jgi:hypothetical protein
MVLVGTRGALPKAARKGIKRSAKGNKRGPKRCPQRIAITISYDEGDNDKEAEDSNEEQVVAAERDFKCQAWQPVDHFGNLLEVTFPNRAYPVRHMLKECSMMKNYMTTGALAKGKKPVDDAAGKATAPLPGEKAVMSIYGGPIPHESRHKLILTSCAVKSVSLAALEFFRWSKSLITFDQMDHPGSISKPRRFPLIVNPLVGMTRLTKALIDGGSGINLMYLDTFEGLGLTRDQLQSSPHPFYGVVSGKQSIPLGWVTLFITFEDASNYHTEALTFKVVDFSLPYHVILGRRCYVMFMAIPSYAYLKLKIPGPTGIITMEAKAQRVLGCEQNNIELATTIIAAAELRELCLRVPLASTDPAKPSWFSAFKVAKGAKAMQIDTEGPSKTIHFGAGLNPK